MGESTLRWPTDKEREEKEEVCSIGEVPHTEKSGQRNERLVIFREEDVGGRERVTTKDEERALHEGAEQRAP